MKALADQAGLSLPLVEEVAADIFTGTFTDKWRLAAAAVSISLDGTLYARYYDLPSPPTWARSRSGPAPKLTRRWGKQVAEDFAALCAARSAEARADTRPGTVISRRLRRGSRPRIIHPLSAAPRGTARRPHGLAQTTTWFSGPFRVPGSQDAPRWPPVRKIIALGRRVGVGGIHHRIVTALGGRPRPRHRRPHRPGLRRARRRDRHWSRWRRRHQAIARACHYPRRTSTAA
jgi:hypothetical protein